jgi:hypothetical protein
MICLAFADTAQKDIAGRTRSNAFPGDSGMALMKVGWI